MVRNSQVYIEYISDQNINFLYIFSFKCFSININCIIVVFGLDTTDIASTTTRSLDLESMMDGQSDSDGDISTTDARAIRKQLEGLESMYSEV